MIMNTFQTVTTKKKRMDVLGSMATDTEEKRNAVISLSKAIQSINFDEIKKYEELCRRGTLLPLELEETRIQINMPAIALALHTLCSSIKPKFCSLVMWEEGYDFDNESLMIQFLIRDCGVDPNAPFRIYGKTKPCCPVRNPVVHVDRSEVPGYYETHTPLRLLLSYYINHREVDAFQILECMEQLIQLGANPSASPFYMDGRKGSLLMAALQSRLTGENQRVDFFRFLLENGARFSPEDEAPLATFLNTQIVLSVDVLALFHKYHKKGQITRKQILDPILIDREPRDAMYIWCKHEPLDEHASKSREIGLLLAMGFRPQSGYDGISDGLSNATDAGNKFRNLMMYLNIAVRSMDQRMSNVHILQGLGKNGMPTEIQENIFRQVRDSENELLQARNALERHNNKGSPPSYN